jgi:hypothetical protein
MKVIKTKEIKDVKNKMKSKYQVKIDEVSDENSKLKEMLE